jgi:mRNA interferase MazF
MEVNRFDVWLINLDPTIGHEIKKTRPCAVISPDEMNGFLATVIVAPMTTVERDFPTRLSLKFKSKKGQIVLDQIRTIDRRRLVRRLGKLEPKTSQKILATLQEIFAP